MAALQRSGLIDSPTKSISMSNLTQSGINGDFPSASNLSTVSAGSVLSLNSTTSGRTKRRAPAPPKKLSPVPPVVPIPEETPSLIYKEEAVVEPKTKVQSPTPAPEPAPRTLGIVKQETVEETVEDVVPPPPAPQSPEADEYRTKALEAQESVEEIIEEASVEDPKTAVPQLQRQDRFEQSLESPMDGPSAEDIEKELAKREKEQRRKERRERREKRAKENEQALATTPQPQLDVIPSPASEEMKEVPVDSPVTSTPKPEKISTFSEAKVHESRVEADPSPKHVPIVEDAKVSEPEPKQPEPETTSSVEPVVVADTKPIVDEEPIEPTLRASTSTVDLASGMKNFKISAYSEFKPIARKSPNILSKIKMFDNYECPERSSTSLPTHFPKSIQTFRQKQASSHLVKHQSNLKDQSTISDVTSIKTHKHSPNLLPKPFISRAQTSSNKCSQRVPSPSPVSEVTIPTISISPPPEVIEKPACHPQTRKMSTSTEEAEALRELDSIVKHFEQMEQESRATVSPKNMGTRKEPKFDKEHKQKVPMREERPCKIQGQDMDIIDTNPDPIIQQSELSIRELRMKMEKEVEKAKNESYMDVSSFSLIRGQVQKTKQIEAFACQVHERNVSFLEQLEMEEHGFNKKGKGKKTLRTMAMGESSYNWEGILGEPESNENIDLSRLSKTPTTLIDLAVHSDEILGSVHKPLVEEGILKTNYNSSGSLKHKRSPKSAKSVSFEEHQKWNKFLKDIGDFSIEIDDENEIIL